MQCLWQAYCITIIILYTLNTQTTYPRHKALTDLISEQAYRTPDRPALKFGNTTLTYQTLNEQANRLANLLIDHGTKTGDIIGLSMDRSAEMVICLLAIMKAGAAYLPLDPGFPEDRLNFMLTDSGAGLLLTTNEYTGLFTADIEKLLVEDALLRSEAYPSAGPNVTVTGDDRIYILYTSGSTGLPKGVQIEHHGMVNLLLSMQSAPGITANDVLLAVTTISFDMAGLELYLPLISGALVIVADAEAVKDGRILLDTVRREKVTIMQATPYTWRMMIAAGWQEKLPLKVLCGGEAMAKKLADNLLERCSALWNCYGPTETTIYSTIKKVEDTSNGITIGLPVNNTQVYIVDEALQPLPLGTAGEICIGGEGMARGYLNRPELNAEKFIPDPQTPGQKIYRTGDLGKIDPYGEIAYLGRIDHQIKIRGFRIETEEIEHILSKLNNVSEAVILAHTDDLDNQRLIAYIQLKDDSLPTSLKDYVTGWTEGLKGKLPDYMLPAEYIIIKQFPVTPNGKIDRKALPKPQLTAIVKNNDELVEPVTETEKTMVGLWEKYLGIKNIGTTDNFFELGGHSIVAVQIMVDIEKMTGQRLPIAILFEYPTIRQLAQWIDDTDKKTTWKSLVRIKAGGNKMPVYLVHGVGLNLLVFNGLAKHLDAEQPVYGLQSLGLNGTEEQLDTVEEIAAHYNSEILEQNPDGPYAVIGYSLGGHIAFEMVKQLEALGKKVKLLGMMDTNLKPSDGDTKAEKIGAKIKRQFPKALFLLRSFIDDPGSTVAYQGMIMKLKVQEALAKLGLYKMQPADDNIPDYMNRLVEKLQHAVSRYNETPYNGRIFLFKAKRRVYFVDEPKYLGWKNYATKGVVVNEVPGDHKDMLLPPNVKQFAKILQRVLDEVAGCYLFLLLLNYMADNF